MSSEERNTKIYGAVETETFMSFEGFCKKIYATEQQEIEVFIDKEKIDTITANKKIPSIEDKYEVFDTVGFCFEYTLPKKCIGKKHLLEFKTKDGKHLLHSPFITIDSLNEKYNEYCFLESLKEKIDEETIKGVYCPNTIGFLATEENLKDGDFINYIKELEKRFSNVNFKIFHFNLTQKKVAENIFKSFNNTEFIIPKNIYQINENCLIWLSTNNLLSLNIKEYMRYPLFINFEAKNLSIQDYENKYKQSFKAFYSNPSKFGEKDNSSFFGVAYNNLIKSLDTNLFIDINTNYFEFSAFKQIDLALKYDKFIEKAKKLSSLLQD